MQKQTSKEMAAMPITQALLAQDDGSDDEMQAPYKSKFINPNRETLPWNAVDFDIEDL